VGSGVSVTSLRTRRLTSLRTVYSLSSLRTGSSFASSRTCGCLVSTQTERSLSSFRTQHSLVSSRTDHSFESLRTASSLESLRTSSGEELKGCCSGDAEGAGVGVDLELRSRDASDVVCLPTFVQDVNIVASWFFANFASKVVEADGSWATRVWGAKMSGWGGGVSRRSRGCWARGWWCT
jgi:hypothetical protein